MNLAVLCSAHVCFHCLGSMTLQGLKDVSVKLKSASTYQNQAMASWPYFKNQMIYHSRHISVVDVIGPCHAKYPQIPKKKHQAQKLFGHEVRFLQHYCWWFRHPAPVDMINMPLFIGFHTSQGCLGFQPSLFFKGFPTSLLLSQDCTAFRQMVMVHTMGKVRVFPQFMMGSMEMFLLSPKRDYRT